MQTHTIRAAVASVGAHGTTPPHAPNVLRWSGAAGALAALILLVASPLYIMMGTPPALSDAAKYAEYLNRISGLALATKLIDTIYVAAFIVFLAGLRELIRTRAAEYEWAATLAFGAGLVSSVIILVGDALGAAAALDTYSAPDAAVLGALTEATLPAFAAIGLLMTALFLGRIELGHSHYPRVPEMDRVDGLYRGTSRAASRGEGPAMRPASVAQSRGVSSG